MSSPGKQPERRGHIVAVAFSALLVVASAAGGADVSSPGERTRADDIARRIEREWPLRGADTVSAYVRTLGAELGAASGTSRSWRFVVFRDHRLRGYAIGDGRIYVSDGSVTQVASESELAALLAHEMGHQLAGHLAGVRDQAHLDEVRIGSVRQRIDPTAELAADRVAVSILRRAGFDPRSVLNLAEGHLDSEDTERLLALRDLVAHQPRGSREDSSEFDRVREELGIAARPRGAASVDDSAEPPAVTIEVPSYGWILEMLGWSPSSELR